MLSVCFCILSTFQFSSVALLCPTLCDPMDCSSPGLPVYHQLRSLLKLMSVESVMPSNHLILCHLLLLLPSIIPSIRAFFKESALHIRWPKYWNFSFSTDPSNEYSGLISFRTDLFDLLEILEWCPKSRVPQNISWMNERKNETRWTLVGSYRLIQMWPSPTGEGEFYRWGGSKMKSRLVKRSLARAQQLK